MEKHQNKIGVPKNIILSELDGTAISLVGANSGLATSTEKHMYTYIKDHVWKELLWQVY